MSPSEFDTWLATHNVPGSDRPPLVMGVLNLTPDSFSDGGKFAAPKEAVEFARAMVVAGADWIDVGGESTRPGAEPVPAAEQIRRTIPVIAALRKQVATLISIDTTQSEVARAALENGANLINDVSSGRDDPNMLAFCAARNVPIILMHMQGKPATMQVNPTYKNVTAEVADFLIERRDAAVAAGIDRRRILFDPGLGFGKNLSQNLRLLRDTADLADLGQPLVVGPSRKRFVGEITGESVADGRVFGTAAVIAWCAANRAAVLRVHDVGSMAAVLRMIQAIRQA